MKDGEKMKQLPRLGTFNTVGMFPPDPMGSYTGRPDDPYEKPVQDADDL